MTPLILYTTEDGKSRIQLRADEQTVWPTQLEMADLFDVEMAIARVAERVQQGGHHIPEDVIRRRFAAGLHNFENTYKSAVDAWAEFDNVGEEPTLLQWGENQ